MLDAEYVDLSEFLAKSSHKQARLVRQAALALLRKPLLTQPVLGSFDAVTDYLYARYARSQTEHFHVLFLDRKNRLIADECLGTGTVDHVPVYPREVIRKALLHNASALILAHNHPSGDPSPSSMDLSMTKDVEKAAQTLGIILHDHIIVGTAGTYSFRSHGDL